MTRPYAPRAFLRHVPPDLLHRFFATEGIPIAIDWDARGDDPDAVCDAWLALPPPARDHAEQMFRAVHDLADPLGSRMLSEEAAFQRADLSALPTHYGHHAKALWVLLGYPTVFHQVALLRHTDRLPGRYWNRFPGLPDAPVDTSPAGRQRLRSALADYFRSEQGRGQRVTVEHYLRAGADHYFFCYPDDYTQTHVGHDLRGTLRGRPSGRRSRWCSCTLRPRGPSTCTPGGPGSTARLWPTYTARPPSAPCSRTSAGTDRRTSWTVSSTGPGRSRSTRSTG